MCAGKEFSVLTSCNLTLTDTNDLIKQMSVNCFPVVESSSDLTLLGYAPTKSIVNVIQVAASLCDEHEM